MKFKINKLKLKNFFKKKSKLIILFLFFSLMFFSILLTIFWNINKSSKTIATIDTKKDRVTYNDEIIKTNDDNMEEDNQDLTIEWARELKNFKKIKKLDANAEPFEYFESDSDKMKILKMLFNILEKKDIKNYDNLNNLFSWFGDRTFHQYFQLIIKGPNDMIELDNDKDTELINTKSIITNLFIFIESFIKQSKNFDLNIFEFTELDIKKLKDNEQKYIMEPFNEFLSSFKFIFTFENELSEEEKKGRSRLPYITTNFEIFSYKIDKYINSDTTKKLGKYIPKIEIEFNGKIKFESLIKFIYRCIKWMIFKIDENSNLNKKLNIKNIKKIIDNYYLDSNKKENRIKFYNYLFNSFWNKIKIDFKFKNDDSFEEITSFKNIIIKFILEFVSDDLNFLERSVLTAALNFYPFKDDIKEEFNKNIDNKIKNIIFKIFEQGVFVSKLMSFIGSERFLESNLIEEFGDNYVNLARTIREYYEKFKKSIKDWFKSEEISDEKLNFIKNLINNLKIETFFEHLKNNEDREFVWDTLKNGDQIWWTEDLDKILSKEQIKPITKAEIEPYITNFNAEDQKILILKYIDIETKQYYSILIEKNNNINVNYKIIYFATNHWEHLIEKFLKEKEINTLLENNDSEFKNKIKEAKENPDTANETLGLNLIDDLSHTDFQNDGSLNDNLTIEKLEAIKTWLNSFLQIITNIYQK